MVKNRIEQIYFLEKRCFKLGALLLKLDVKLAKVQQRRLLLAFAIAVTLFQFYFKYLPGLALSFAFVLISIFVSLVFLTKKIRNFSQAILRLQNFYQRQLQRCRGLPALRKELAVPGVVSGNHAVHDLNLLGSHSLWSMIDETFSEQGARLLLGWMLGEPPLIAEISKRHQWIHQLRDLRSFYVRLCVSTNSNLDSLQMERFNFFLEKQFVNPAFKKVVLSGLILWVVSLAILLLNFYEILNVPSLVLLIFPMASLFSLGQTSGIFSQANDLTVQLAKISEILKAIEARSISHVGLRDLCGKIVVTQPSSKIKTFDFLLGLLGTQTNPLLHILINFFLPWTILVAYFLERARQSLAADLPKCFAEVAELEAYGSLVIFDFYQTHHYPVLSAYSKLAAKGIYHPLILSSKVVRNDFQFAEGKCLGLLTGSNMSGKSTFLRTLGVNQVLANMGAPVFADRLETCPFRVLTCIEISDSLRDGFSYFFAEVQRLKEIVDAIEIEKPALFLIDEIFRGTNNRERQIGSRGILLALSKRKLAQGFISTHDLELTQLEQINPGQENFHFRDSIDSDGQMIFSFLLKAGPCPTTNALRIMKAQGLPVDPADDQKA